MSFKKILSDYKNRLNIELEIFFKKKILESRKISSASAEMVDFVREFTMRGQSKRFRAFLIVCGYEGFGGKNRKEIFRCAPFIEIVHSYLLMHDDIIDQDDLRRGGPTAHKFYEKAIIKSSIENRRHMGMSMAILAGDIGCALGLEMFMRARFEAQKKIRATEKINELLSDVIHGETLDVVMQIDSNAQRSDIVKVYEFKTARYSISQPLEIGAILAGASTAELRAIRRMSIPVGIAFQIKDDLLGLFGETEEIGKPAGSDIREGKQTLLLSLAMEKATGAQKKRMRELLGRPDISKIEIEEFRDIVRATGAMSACQNMIDENIAKGKKELDKIESLNKKTRNILFMLFDYINQRTH